MCFSEKVQYMYFFKNHLQTHVLAKKYKYMYIVSDFDVLYFLYFRQPCN